MIHLNSTEKVSRELERQRIEVRWQHDTMPANLKTSKALKDREISNLLYQIVLLYFLNAILLSRKQIVVALI